MVEIKMFRELQEDLEVVDVDLLNQQVQEIVHQHRHHKEILVALDIMGVNMVVVEEEEQQVLEKIHHQQMVDMVVLELNFLQLSEILNQILLLEHLVQVQVVFGSLEVVVVLVDLEQLEEKVVVQEVLLLEQVMVEMVQRHQRVPYKAQEVVVEAEDIPQQILQVM